MSINPEFIRILERGDKGELAVYQARANAAQVYQRFQSIASKLRGNSGSDERKFNLVLTYLAQASSEDSGFIHPPSLEGRMRSITGTLTRVLQLYPSHVGELFEDYQPIFNAQNQDQVIFKEANIESYGTKFEPMILFALKLKQEGKSIPIEYTELFAMFEAQRL